MKKSWASLYGLRNKKVQKWDESRGEYGVVDTFLREEEIGKEVDDEERAMLTVMLLAKGKELVQDFAKAKMGSKFEMDKW